MTVRSQFTAPELEAIRAATQEAEKETGGELVCVIVNRCDTYSAPLWQATALGALAGSLAAGIWYQSVEAWPTSPLSLILLPPILGAALALLAVAALPPLRRWLTPPSLIEARVDRRAAAAFFSEEISDTRDRTGLLLFVTLFERQIRILADQGLKEKVPEEAWQQIVTRLTRDLQQSDRKGDAIVDAIQACGRVLTARGVDRREDDQDELDNQPRLLDD